MDKLDKTKDNVGISKLDESTRKQLFDKFVDSGGQVVDEKTKRRNLVIDRERQRQFKKKLEKKSQAINKKYPQKTDNKPSVKKVKDGDPSTLLNPLSRLRLKFRLKFLGVTNFSGYYISGKFLKKFNSIYKPALMELQIIYLELFRKNPVHGRKIISRLDSEKPLLYELIEKSGNIFDKILVDQVVEHYHNYPDIPQKSSELKDAFTAIYKKLYVLHQYDNSIVNAYSAAIDIHAKVDDEDISPYSLKRKIRNSVFIVFHKMYPRLHLLFCFYTGRSFDIDDRRIEKYLSLSPSEKLGSRKINQVSDKPVSLEEKPEEEPKQEEAEEKKEEKTESPKSKAIKKGLEMMSRLDMAQLRREYDKARIFEQVSEGDKVLITFILFNEFDKEYSFILTTNKLKFNIDFGDRAKTDFNARLNSLYDEMRKSSTLLKQYAEELIGYERARREKPTDSSQYIEFTKRLESIEKKKNNVGKNALYAVKDFMRKVAHEMAILIEDMNGAQNYLVNPQDILEFDENIEGIKKLKNRKNYEAIYLIYCFSAAFVYRLDSGGDLSGQLEFNEEEIKSMKKEAVESGATSSPLPEPEKKEEKKDKTVSHESILDELEDML